MSQLCKDGVMGSHIECCHFLVQYSVFNVGVKLAISLLRSPSLARLGARLKDEFIQLPQCADFDVNTDDYWRCLIEHMSNTMHHFTGTCRMGDVKHPTTVVDPSLRYILSSPLLQVSIDNLIVSFCNA